MSKTTSFALGDHFQTFINAQIHSGRFNNASEVVRTALRMLEEHEQKVESLRSALIEGEESGVAEKFDKDQFLKTMHEKHID